MSRSETDVCMLTTGFPRFEGDLFGSFMTSGDAGGQCATSLSRRPSAKKRPARRRPPTRDHHSDTS